MTDIERRLRELEDEVRYLRRRLDDAIARPPVVVPWPSPSMPPIVSWEAPHGWPPRGPTCEPIL